MRLLTASARCLFALLLAAAAGSAPSTAQLPPAGSVQVPGSVPDTGPSSGDLIALPADALSVLYPPGSLVRASLLQTRLRDYVLAWGRFADRRLGWSLSLVTSEAWQSSGLGSTGAPRWLGAGRFVAPAEGEPGTIALVRRLLGGPVPDLGAEASLGTREEANSLAIVDLLLEVEMGRALTAEAPLASDRPWVAGVLGQLALRVAWERAAPGQTLGYVSLLDTIAGAQGGPRAHRLDDYRPGLPYETELWYQAQFVRGADAIFVEAGLLGASRRLDKWAGKGKGVSAAELVEKFPALADWQRQAFAP